MTIQVGDRVPDATLFEFIEVEGNGCSVGPNAFKVADIVGGKKIAVFGLPGAFTPTCSAQHVHSYVKHFDALKAKGISEVWCVSVNDAFVMGAWARDQKAAGKVRMMADGSAEFTKKLGLELDLTARGIGLRMPALRPRREGWQGYPCRRRGAGRLRGQQGRGRPRRAVSVMVARAAGGVRA